MKKRTTMKNFEVLAWKCYVLVDKYSMDVERLR